MAQYRELFRMSATHTYYGGMCRDFEFVLPEETRRLMQRGGMVAREIDGILYVIYETDGATGPASPITDSRFRVGLRPINPNVLNVTNLLSDFPIEVRGYISTDISTLTALGNPILVDQVFRHTLRNPGRPITVEVRNEWSTLLYTETVTDSSQTEIVLDGTRWPRRWYVVHELAQAVWLNSTQYYVDPEFRRLGAISVVDIDIWIEFTTENCVFEVPFEAKEETLRYYVVADRYTDLEMSALTVNDIGYGADGRSRVTFTRVESGAFTADELPISLVATAGQKLVMFKSTSAIPRRGAGRRGIQLLSGSDVIVDNLPQPSPDKVDAHMIVHIAKP